MINCMRAVFYITFFVYGVPAWADPKSGHPPQDAKLHEDFYSKWKMSNGNSCCNDQDCYPTLARINSITGEWEFLRREDKMWVAVPQEAYYPEWVYPGKPESPDGNSHVCAVPPDKGSSGIVYCFAPGTGT